MTKNVFDTKDKSVILFQREQAQDCFAEVIPLLHAHGRELKYYSELKLDPEFSRYEQLEKLALLRSYTARLDGNIIGYAVFFFAPHLHFRTKIFATCDILFIKPDHRGFGLRFIRWCNDQLRKDGAYSIHYYVNTLFDYGRILKRIGFEHTAELYSITTGE